MPSNINVFLGEFLGTLTLILMGNGICANVNFKKSLGHNAGWISIAFGWGLAVFTGILVANIFGTGGHLNPAVTIGKMVGINGNSPGLATIGTGFIYIGSELLGAFVGQIIINTIFFQHIKEEEEYSVVRGMHCTHPTHEKAKYNNFFTELVATIILVTVAYFALSSKTTNSPGYMGPLYVGLTVVAIGLSLGGTTGYAINPARDFMPRVVFWLMYKFVLKKEANVAWNYSWIPVAAPAAAGIIMGSLYYI